MSRATKTAAPIGGGSGTSCDTRAPARNTGTGGPGTLEAVTSLAVAADEMISNGMKRLISANWSAKPSAGSARQRATVAPISAISATGSWAEVLTVKCAMVTAFWPKSSDLRRLIGMLRLSCGTGAPCRRWYSPIPSATAAR